MKFVLLLILVGLAYQHVNACGGGGSSSSSAAVGGGLCWSSGFGCSDNGCNRAGCFFFRSAHSY